ncbi:DNA-3-methyladenine glycosylase family protein [Nonomuraea sp. NPDC049269]|uniref:DNA-3-methyladenine glycosylase family protein n=1 Tax=Nonomuraea sp. NPDC049269 TaxID=3364349 RepID=UPI003720489A
MTTITLPATAPFDFAASLRFLRRFPATAGEQQLAEQSLTKALRAGGQTMVARLTPADEGLRCDLHADQPLTEQAVSAAADRLSFYLSLADDLAPFYAIGKQDLPFALVMDHLYGYHQVKFPSPLENLVWAILCQRVPMAVATKAKDALVSHVGNRLTFDGEEYAAFPDLDQLLAVPADLLTAFAGNSTKGDRLYASLRAWAEVDEHFLRTAPYDEVKDFLRGLPGIGPWSASFILIRGLGRMDEAPIDRELVRSAARVYGRQLSEDELRGLAGRYGSWQGYWAHYLRA